MSNDSMIRKIAALMAKANGTDNEHESEVFMSKAKELMDKHGIKADDLDTNKVGHGDADFTVTADLIWQSKLVWATARYFNTIAIQSRDWKTVKFNVVGRESDRVTVSLMFPYLLKECRRKAAELINGKSLQANTRDIGLALSVILNELAGEEDAELRKYIDEGFRTVNIKSKTRVSNAAREKAKSINLNRQVNSAKKVKSLA